MAELRQRISELEKLETSAGGERRAFRQNSGDDMINPILKGPKVRIAIMAVLLATSCFLTYYFHAVLGTGIVFTHFFYIPIILASLWWKRKGILVAIFLSVVLIASHYILRVDVLTQNDYFRGLMFVGVSLVTVMLSERIVKSEEALRRLNKELEEKTVALEQANIRLQEVDRLKSVFLASMSHELRTPLNSIIGFTGIILQGMTGEITEEQRKQLTMVKNSANHLLGLINDVLDISKIESGKVGLSLEEFRFNDVVTEVVETFSPAVSEKGLELTTEVPENITLFSDRRRTKQVLMNLVSNAVKFTDQGSVQIAAIVPGDDNLEVRVIDTGIGIKQEDMDKLFQPFQQIDVSLTKKREGTGLGLHLTMKLVALLRGDISARSEYGRGSEFTFTIPLRYEEEQRNEEDTGG